MEQVIVECVEVEQAIEKPLCGPCQKQPTRWPLERAELARKYWLAGMTAQEIAQRLHYAVTRNAVIGKATRSGWVQGQKIKPNRVTVMSPLQTVVRKIAPLRGHTVQATPARHKPRARARSSQLTIGIGFSSGIGFKADYKPNKTLTAFNEAIPLELRKQIWELDSTQCHWPVGNPGDPSFFFCGQPRDTTCRQPYCAGHRAFNGRPRS